MAKTFWTIQSAAAKKKNLWEELVTKTPSTQETLSSESVYCVIKQLKDNLLLLNNNLNKADYLGQEINKQVKNKYNKK